MGRLVLISGGADESDSHPTWIMEGSFGPYTKPSTMIDEQWAEQQKKK